MTEGVKKEVLEALYKVEYALLDAEFACFDRPELVGMRELIRRMRSETAETVKDIKNDEPINVKP